MHTWTGGRRIPKSDRAATVVRGAGGPDAKQAAIVWLFSGEMQSVHWRPAHVVLAGRGNEVYAFDEETLELKLYLDTGFGFQRFLTPPGLDRVIVLGTVGLCVLTSEPRELWRVEELRTQEALEFDGYHEEKFTLKGRQRPADDWTMMEFDIETGPVVRRKKGGPGAQPAK